MPRRSRSNSNKKTAEAPAAEAASSVRADKWLWAARCFKTRSQATDACNNELCKVNDRIAKPSQPIKVGDTVDVECPGGRRILLVKALADRRGPASAAALLYEDNSPEPPPPEVIDDRYAVVSPTQKPSKQQRRQLRKIRGY